MLYVFTLMVLTHLPRQALPESLSRQIGLDKLAHLLAFAGLAVLIWRVMPKGWTARRLAERTLLVCAAYACIDEATQAIPGLHRVPDWLDLLANLAGAALGVGVCLWRRITTR